MLSRLVVGRRRPLTVNWCATSSGNSRRGLDGILSTRLRETAKELSVEMLPALKVLSESLGLLRQSPALRSWSTSDWLVGLSVLAQYKSKQNIPGLHKEVHKKSPVEDQKLLSMLLRYIRVCHAVYAPSVAGFCEEAGVSRDCVLRAHSGGVVSPKCVILVDHEHQELVLIARGTASLLDFCTDLCLHNEPFLDGQGHRGMVHATAWLVHHLRDDLRKLSGEYPDYRFVATGHSLGGAVAALSTMQLRNEFPTMQCYAFGTPACVTQKLATDSYDIVTTIVNGYDCVPRLHQHSLMKLQDEIRRFDWKAALKEMVAEEIQNQRTALEKQQHAKLEELQKALQKLDYFQLKQRTKDATAKLDQVKQAASDNILEVAHDVDTLLADKVNAIISYFKVDNLLNFDDVKRGDSIWWKRMNESVSALDRLLEPVKKNEELERVMVELKELFQKTPATARKLLQSEDDHTTKDDASVSAQLQYSVDNIIDKTRTSLKVHVSDQMSKVSSALTSNVKEVVGTLKEETEALGAVVQEELDKIADTISRNLPFAMDAKSRKTLDTKYNHVFEDIDPSQRIEDKVRKEKDQEWEDVKKDEKQWQKDNKLCHDPLFPPGRILYLNRIVTKSLPKHVGSTSNDKVDQDMPDSVEFVEVASDDFSRVVLSNRMLLDHLCTDYEKVLQCVAKLQNVSDKS